MILYSLDLGVTVSVLGYGLLLLLLIWVIRRADWKALASKPYRLHLLIASILGLYLFWSMNFAIADGVRLHLLGMTFITLMLGFPFAVLAGSVASFAMVVLGDVPVGGALVHVAVSVLVPAVITRLWLYALSRLRIQNLFIYLLGVGFVGSLLSAIIAILISAGLLWGLSGSIGTLIMSSQDWPLVFLLLFPEGFINGMMTSAVTLYAPHLMKTYDEAFYLRPSKWP